MPTLAELYPALGVQSSQFGGQLGSLGNVGDAGNPGTLGSLGRLGMIAALSRGIGGGGQLGSQLGALGRFTGQGTLGAGTSDPTRTVASGSGGPGSPDLNRALEAISRVESGSREGNYGLRGPETRYGRALGRYQVLPTNVGPWTERWFGRRLTPDEFLASPEAQDAVFRGQFGSYMSRYGNPQDAASMWFTGRPYSEGRTRTDAIPGVYRGISGEEYVRRFTAGF